MNFSQPGWLILLVLLPMLGAGAVAGARLRRRQWSEFTAPRLRPSLLRLAAGFPRWLGLVLLLAACATLIIGLARPQGDNGTTKEKSLGRNVLVALDLSRSMRVEDVSPDRLSLGKLVIYEMLEAMPNERIGLIGFAGNAYTYAPLTIDHQAVRETVEQIDETWAPVGGSNLSSAVKLAIETFEETGQKNNALVIISDGEEHRGNLDDMVAQAERSGVYILAVGVGTEDGDYVPNPEMPGGRMVDSNGKHVISRLQPDVMKQLASETKGRYALAGSGVDIPVMIKSAIRDLDAFEIEGRERLVYIEFYQWILLPGILLLMMSIFFSTRWRGITTTAVVSMLAFFPCTTAADPVGRAREAFVEGRYEEARDLYAALAEDTRLGDRRATFRLGQASAASRAGDFKHARTAFSDALLSTKTGVRASAHSGMGFSLFQIGWKILSGEPYPASTDDLPNLEHFDELVKKRFDEILSAGEDDSPPANGSSAFKALISNWTDAVRHFDSSLGYLPNSQEARHNRTLTLTYLRRLNELLREEQESTKQSIQPESPEDQGDQQENPPPSDGEGDGEKEPDEPGEGPPDPDKQGGNGDQESDQDPGNQPRQNEDEQSADDEGNEEQEEGENENGEPETPEERARRILEESSDREKGPLTPGRIEFRNPEKDW